MLCSVSLAEGPESPDSDTIDLAAMRSELENAPITPSSHGRETGYMAAFQTQMLSFGPYRIHLESRVYEESLLRGGAEILWNDLAAIEAAVGALPESVTVYLVAETIAGAPADVGTHVFCTAADLESGAYREHLIGAGFGFASAWQRAGLTEYVFGEADDAWLKEYYADGAHALTLSCSPLHLSPLLSDEETVKAARASARSIAAYLLERDGFSAFSEAESSAAVLPAWADSMGIPLPAEWNADARIDRVRVDPQWNYVCVITSDCYEIYLKDDSFLKDTDGLYAWFCAFYAGMSLVTEQIREEAPSAFETAEQNLNKGVRIYFTDPNSYTYTMIVSNEIYLSRPENIWHEMVHILIKQPNWRPELGWESEAIAEHFSRRAQTLYAPTRYIADGWDGYLQFFAEVSMKEAAPDDLIFHQSVWNLYQAFRDPKLTDDDLSAYCRAYGISSLLLADRIVRTQARRMYDLSVASKRGSSASEKGKDGNALSYPESLVLFEYLCAVYGTDEVVKAHFTGVKLQDAFGKEYPMLFTEAKAYYAERYPDLPSIP